MQGDESCLLAATRARVGLRQSLEADFAAVETTRNARLIRCSFASVQDFVADSA